MSSTQVKPVRKPTSLSKSRRSNRKTAEITAPPLQGTDWGATETPTSPYQVRRQVGHLLRRAYQRHVALFQQGIPDSQLTTPQFVTLCAVRDLGSCSLNEIVTETLIDQATIRGVVERLSARKLLAIAGHPSDKRKLSIALTSTGHQFLQKMILMAQNITEQTFGSLNTAERVALLYLLEKMCVASNNDQ